MDVQLFVALNAMTISALIIAVAVIWRPQGHGDWLATNGPWVGANAAVLAVGGLALWLAPEVAGILVAAVFVPFVAAPVYLFAKSQQQTLAGNRRSAAFYARLAALLHPTIANRLNARLAAAMAGDDETNARALTQLAADAPREYKPYVNAQLAFAKRDWREVLALTNASPPNDSFMKPMEVRALGETGAVDAMVRCYMDCRTSLAGVPGALAKLAVLALGGRPDGARVVINKQFAKLPDEAKSYWLAVAQINGPGDTSAGERTLARLSTEATTEATRTAALRHLGTFTRGERLLPTGATRAALDGIERQELAEATVPARPVYALPVTLTLIALNLAAFAAEVWMGGAEDQVTLLTLGALKQSYVLEYREWWRLLSAMFLHYGALHLGSNMFVLWVLGRLLEPMVGSLRMILIYLGGGLASSAFVLWLMTSGLTPADFLVGASGAIFALLGAETTIVLLDWWRHRDTFDTRRLTTLGVVLAIQVAIDLSVPNVSFAAHASGFVAGMIGMLLMPLRRGFGMVAKNRPGVRT